jgi:hypothetical protein
MILKDGCVHLAQKQNEHPIRLKRSQLDLVAPLHASFVTCFL